MTVVATASIGLDATNQNREVDLNLFPTEFFNRVTVYKSPTASLVEGGASGVVDMRNSRPFDISGNQITYSLQADHNTNSGGVSPRGSVIGNWTNQAGTFGALVKHGFARTADWHPAPTSGSSDRAELAFELTDSELADILNREAP